MTKLWLLGDVLLTLALRMAIISVSFLNPIVHTMPLILDHLSLCLILSTIVFLAVGFEKLGRQRKRVSRQ